MEVQICNKKITLKTFILLNVLLFLALFLFIDLYFYNVTTVVHVPTMNSRVVLEQERFLAKMRSKKILNNCMAFDIDENRFEPHDEDNLPSSWVRVRSPHEPHFFMYTTDGKFPVSKSDYAKYKMMHKHVYKSPDNTTSSECELVLHVGGENCGAGLYAAAHNYNVILFEPFRRQNIMTRESIKLNAFHDVCVTSLNMFVSNGDEENVEYKTASKSSGLLTSITIDTFLSRNKMLSQCIIQNMNIDLEGFNVNVIYGAKRVLASSKVKTILFRYAPWVELSYLPFKTWEFLLPFVDDLFHADEDKPLVFALTHEGSSYCLGPIKSRHFKVFHDYWLEKRVEVDLFAVFDKEMKNSFAKRMDCKPWRAKY